MPYAAIMVYVEADATPEHRVRLAATLAGRFNSMLIGLSALALPPPIVADGMLLDGPTSMDIDLMNAKLTDRGKWFRSIAVGGPQRSEWRSSIDLPIEAVTRAARSADLVVIGRVTAMGDPYSALDPGEAVLKMGRPTLVVPDGVSALRAEHVVIGWKDTREARRAVYDALPLLQSASRVTIVEAYKGDEENAALRNLDDLTRYLTLHRINGGPRVILEQRSSGAAQLIRVAQEEGADLLVTGAYGHSRLGEWVFGGMTKDLIATSPICCLMSH
jgi:nucleotide-binding universal stress UspA family protein